MKCPRNAWRCTTALLSLALVVGFAPSEASAQGPGTGADIGVGLGKGTFASGITLKYYLDSKSAIQGHFGYTSSWGWRGCPEGPGFDCDATYGFGLNVDYIQQISELASGTAGALIFAAGGGGAISSGGLRSPPFFAINGVLELGWQFRKVPIELVIDWRPLFSFGPGNAFFGFWDAGFSARFYF